VKEQCCRTYTVSENNISVITIDLPVVEEDHGQNNSTSGRVTALWVTCGIECGRLPVGGVCGRPDGEAYTHTGSRDKE
jgi:hypothetical protein